MTEDPWAAAPQDAPQEPEEAPQDASGGDPDVCPVCGLRGRPEGHH